MSEWIDEQIEMAKVLNEHGLEKILQALKKSEAALKIIANIELDCPEVYDAIAAIEDLGKE